MSNRTGKNILKLNNKLTALFSGAFFSNLIAWVYFCATCLHLTFMVPGGGLLPGYREKLYSGVMCSATLAVVWIFRRNRARVGGTGEFTVSVILAVIVYASALLSSTPWHSTARGFVVLSAGWGGFWCARMLLHDEPNQRFFRAFCLVLLSTLLVVCVWNYYTSGNIYELVDTNPHPVADRILLLWFAPLSLLLSRPLVRKLVGGLQLLISFVVFYLSDLRSAFFIPVALLGVASFFKTIRLKYAIGVLILAGVATVYFVKQLPWEKIGKEYEPAYYRAENYPFSFHIAVKRPLLGIGLTAPRGDFLEDYTVKYPYITKEKFAQSVERIGVSENIFLTFIAELGFPFVILYGGALIILVGRLVRETLKPFPHGLLHPIVLLLPITAGILHFLVYDGLLHPQVSWFFHILLGLTPIPNKE
jgi:hypothetical protein